MLYPLSLFLVDVLSCTMLRYLVRLRPPALLISRTPSGIRWVVACAWVAEYGCIRTLSLIGCCFELCNAAVSGAVVLALSVGCVHVPLCIDSAVVLFATKPSTLCHARHSTALSFWV